MIDAKKIAEILEQKIPSSLAEPWDNVGLLLDCGEKTDKILFSLDITGKVVEEAKRFGCGIIVSHHPVMLGGVKKLKSFDPIVAAAKSGISLIAMHTNFDAADGGVNDILAEKLGLLNVEQTGNPIAKRGSCFFEDSASFAAFVKEQLGCDSVGYTESARPINSVIVFGGAGAPIEELFYEGCDAIVTGELKHHDALLAEELGLCVVAAGHFKTENPAVIKLLETVKNETEGVECLLSECGADPIKHI